MILAEGYDDAVMLDLECMGSKSDSAIVSIGAVVVNLLSGKVHENVFYQTVSLQSSVQYGGKIYPDTVMWWLQQSEAARNAIRPDTNTVTIATALASFRTWMSYRSTQVTVWGNGADYDNIVLTSAYERLGAPCPWNFRANRCYRTLKNIYPEIELVRTGEHHNALDDAISQANHLVKLIDRTRGVER